MVKAAVIEDEMDVIIVLIYFSGLCHAGDEHNSSLPDSATYSTPDTPSKLLPEFHLQFRGRRAINCLDADIRLLVTKALGHLDQRLRRDGCPLGSSGWCAQLLAPGVRQLYGCGPGVVVGGTGSSIHEQQPEESPPPLGLGIREGGSGEVPPRPAPMLTQERR